MAGNFDQLSFDGNIGGFDVDEPFPFPDVVALAGGGGGGIDRTFYLEVDPRKKWEFQSKSLLTETR